MDYIEKRLEKLETKWDNMSILLEIMCLISLQTYHRMKKSQKEEFVQFIKNERKLAGYSELSEDTYNDFWNTLVKLEVVK